MGRIGRVLSWVAGVISGDVKNDPGGGALLQSKLAQDGGADCPPLPDDYVITVESQGTGETVAVGVVDGHNALSALPGERRTYARNAAGEIVVTFHEKRDGSARLSNASGHFELQADGEVNINGVRITPGGDVITPNGVSLRNHPHNQGADSDGDAQVATNAPTATE